MTIPGVVKTVASDDREDIDVDSFKELLAHYPSGVTIVTTTDAEGVPYGFTASSFCSVSLDPPLVSVCLARSARCYPVFATCDEFAVNFLQPHHADLAMTFARKRDDKFAHASFRQTDSRTVILEDALGVLECRVYNRFEAGDHTLLIGRVQAAGMSAGEPLVLYNRAFHRIASLEC